MTTKIASLTKQSNGHSQGVKGLNQHANFMMKKPLLWLSPINSLDSEPCSRFGRNIERELNALDEHKGVMKLKLRKRDTAVVLSIEHYEAMLEMKETLTQLIAAERDRIITEATDDYEALYSRITSPESRRAADTLFSASSEDLRETYQPGRTESK